MVNPRRRVLVTGCAGMLGGELAAAFANSAVVLGTDLGARPSSPATDEFFSLDITDESAVQAALDSARPDVVVHCAALVDVDAAESDFALAREVNALGTRNIARHAPAGCKIVYMSTDSVFDGTRGGYAESDLPCPLNSYAKTKLEGEWFAQIEAQEHLVLRTNFVGGRSAGKPSIATWIVETLSRGESVGLAEDWITTTLHVRELARLVVEMVDAGAVGLYHAAGGEACSKYEFGLEIARVFGLDAALIERKRFAQLSFAAPRPRDASLDCSRAEALLGKKLPTYRSGVELLHAEWKVQ